MKIPSNKQQRNPVILITAIFAALFCSAGIAMIVDWGVSPAKTPGEGSDLIARLRGGDANPSAVSRRDADHEGGVARPSVRCAGCGVIESILVLDARDETTGVCAAGDWLDDGFGGGASVGADARNRATLAEIVTDVVVKDASAHGAAPYELTIRFRDGSRTTIRLAKRPRWKPGERVQVINRQT